MMTDEIMEIITIFPWLAPAFEDPDSVLDTPFN